MFNMNERVYNPQSQIQSVPHQVSMFHPQALQVIYPQPSVIHPQSYQVIHPQSSQVIHLQASQALVVSLQSSAYPIQVASSLVAPYFLPTDDTLECLTKALTFMSTILALSYPSSNNQLKILSNPVHQVAMPERQTLSYVGERIDFGTGAFTVTTNALFQADGVEVYDSDCDDIPNAQPSFMANISSSDSDVLAEVHNPDNIDNNMINQVVPAMPSSEQSSVVNHSETKITSDNNIIPYSQYVTESQQAAVQNSNSSAQQDTLILSAIEQLKSQIFYDHITKQALGFQNPFYLKKAQQLEPKLYDGNVIKNASAIVILDSEETLMLAKESRSKMLLKQQDPMMLENKNFMNSSDPSPSCRPTKVEVPKELPKVSMVNTSLKKLKHHLAGFDVVVKERTTATAITEDQSQDKYTVIKKLKEIIKSLSGNINEDMVKKDIEEIETINIELDHRVSKLIFTNEHLNQTYKQLYESIKPTRVRSQEQCDALVNQVNQKSVEISDLNASLQEKVLVITALKNELRKLIGKSVIACHEFVNKPKVITLVVHKVDLEPLTPKLKNNREAHVDYIRITKENADTLRDIVEQARTSIHDFCVVQHLSEVNDRARAKAVKSIKMKEWKPTGKMFKNVGYKWVPTGRTFTIVGTKCPLTRFTSTKIVPPRKPVKSTVITNIKPSSASQWRPKETNHASSSSAPKIVESRSCKSYLSNWIRAALHI
ncbi:hypothetical protein Tco_1385806 [Tanacetum coccineum]